MRRHNPAFFAILALLFCTPAYAGTIKISVAESIAIVSDYSGTCTVRHAGSTDPVSAEIGLPLYEGDELSTTADSRLVITFDNTTILRLEPNTELKLTELKRQKDGPANTVLKLTVGRIMTIVDKLIHPKSTFEVHTRMAVAAVKGTELAIDAEGDSSLLGVFEGRVMFTGTTGPGVEVGAGMESGTGADGKPSPAQELKSMLRYRDAMNSLRQTIEFIRLMKEGNALDQYYEAKAEEKKKSGAAGPEATPSAGDELKKRLRNEMRDDRRQSLQDLGFAINQAKVDFNTGRVATDMNGNRYRLEEYIYRPVDTVDGAVLKNRLNTLSMTFRTGRTDFIMVENEFINDLPDGAIPACFWESEWVTPDPYGTFFDPAGGNNALVSQKTTYSNCADRVEQDYFYSVYADIDWWNGTTPPPQQKLIRVRNEELLTLNGAVKEHRYLGSFDYNYGYANSTFGYSMVKSAYDDLTFYNNSFNGSAQPFEVIYSFPQVIGVPGNESMPLWRKVKKIYNDGTSLEFGAYFIDDNGALLTETLGVTQILGNGLNVELTLSSPQFTAGDIDAVSGLLFYRYFNDTSEYDNGRIMGFEEYIP